MNCCGNSIKRRRQPKMAKIIKLRGSLPEFTVIVGLIRGGGGLLTMCSSRLGAYSRGGGLFRGGGDNSMIYGTEAGTAIWLAGAIAPLTPSHFFAIIG